MLKILRTEIVTNRDVPNRIKGKRHSIGKIEEKRRRRELGGRIRRVTPRIR